MREAAGAFDAAALALRPYSPNDVEGVFEASLFALLLYTWRAIEGQCLLNAWCELHGEDLSGRCPQIRVGLPTSPEGKGANSTCSMWTPSSPYSTSSWMTSASLTPPNSDAPDPQPPSVRAKSSPWPSSLGGRGSPARGTSTATLRHISEQHSLLSQTVPSSTVSCDSMPRTSRRSP